MVFEVLQKGVKDFEPIVLAVEILRKTLGTSALNVLKERNFLKVGKYICTLLINALETSVRVIWKLVN